MTRQKVLIVGAGVSGSILAYWLGKNDFEVLVIERSRANQKAGQGIEIEDPALDIVKAMGIMAELEAIKTGEKGFQVVDEQSRIFGTFEAGAASVTGELEMMRGDLVEVLYRTANKWPNVKYEYETTIASISQAEDECTVELKRRDGSSRHESFQFVVGADGAKSQTRSLMMSEDASKCYKDVGVYCAYFSVPKHQSDSEYSQLCNFPRRRIIWTRPVAKNSKVTSVYLLWAAGHDAALHQAVQTGTRTDQKQILSTVFKDVDWHGPRIINEMMDCENFYCDELRQVKLSKWSNHRVVLVGDSAWAPTPVTGQGNQLAIIGAWVLAQEMSRDRSPSAFEAYEQRLRKYVEDCQAIPLRGYAPFIFNPETRIAIWLLRNGFRVLSSLVRFWFWTGWSKFVPESNSTAFDLQLENQ